MSLGVVVKGPEGVVIAADSRITLNAVIADAPAPLFVSFDNATKIISLGGRDGGVHSHIAAVTYGSALIGDRTAHGYLPEFEVALPQDRLAVLEYARRMSQFFGERWSRAEEANPGTAGPVFFIVGGYDEGAAYGSVFLFSLPHQPEPIEQNVDTFGMTWGGQLDVATRLIHGSDPNLPQLLAEQLHLEPDHVAAALRTLRPQLEWRVPYQVLPLQDCVNLATFLIRATINAQRLSIGVRGVGGVVEVAAITRTEGLKFIRQKSIHSEEGAA